MPIEFPLNPEGDAFALQSELDDVEIMLGDIDARISAQATVLNPAMGQNEIDSKDAIALQAAKDYADAKIAAAQLAGVDTPPDLTPYALQSGLSRHISTDAFKWQGEYDKEREMYIANAGAMGFKLSGTSVPYTVTNSAFEITGTEYNVLITAEFTNPEENTFTVITVNGQEVYSTEGLYPGSTVRKTFYLFPGDTMSASRETNVTVEYLVPDPDSQLAKIVAQLTSNISDVYAAAVNSAKEIYEGTGSLNYDMTQPTKVMGTGGLITLGGSEGFTVPQNGCLIVTYSALVGAAKSILVDGDVVWSAVLSLLGASTTKSPSDPIRVNTGQVVTSTGLVGVGEALDVTFYPNA